MFRPASTAAAISYGRPVARPATPVDRRRCESALHWPAVARKSAAQRLIMKTKVARPATQRLGLSSEIHHLDAPAVFGLFARRCPSTIAGLVVAIVVNAVKLQPGRASAQIGDEVGDGVPPRADLDAAAAVVGVKRAPMVVATLHHLAPSGIEGVLAESVTAYGLPVVATAADHRAAQYSIGPWCPHLSTLAPTHRVRTTGAGPLPRRKHSKTAECRPHGRALTEVRHKPERPQVNASLIHQQSLYTGCVSAASAAGERGRC